MLGGDSFVFNYISYIYFTALGSIELFIIYEVRLTALGSIESFTIYEVRLTALGSIESFTIYKVQFGHIEKNWLVMPIISFEYYKKVPKQVIIPANVGIWRKI